jgi:hypothetical protein
LASPWVIAVATDTAIVTASAINKPLRLRFQPLDRQYKHGEWVALSIQVRAARPIKS